MCASFATQDAREPAGARGETEYCDALVTDAPRVLFGVKTADCVPILLGDARSRAVAAIHAGWRGTLALIVAKTIERMREQYGTRAVDIRAAIGPAARGCCYEVGAEVIEAFRESFPGGGELLTQTRAGHALIDLQRANRQQLIAAGVLQERIHVAPLCTMCRTDLFFSYRREKSQQGRVGRLMSVIGKPRGQRLDVSQKSSVPALASHPLTSVFSSFSSSAEDLTINALDRFVRADDADGHVDLARLWLETGVVRAALVA